MIVDLTPVLKMLIYLWHKFYIIIIFSTLSIILGNLTKSVETFYNNNKGYELSIPKLCKILCLTPILLRIQFYIHTYNLFCTLAIIPVAGICEMIYLILYYMSYHNSSDY